MSDKLNRVVITLCEDCLNGVGKECHTPGCALIRRRCPDFAVDPDTYQVLPDREVLEGFVDSATRGFGLPNGPQKAYVEAVTDKLFALLEGSNG